MKSIIIALAASTCMAVQLKTDAPKVHYVDWKDFKKITGHRFDDDSQMLKAILMLLADKDGDGKISYDEIGAFLGKFPLEW